MPAATETLSEPTWPKSGSDDQVVAALAHEAADAAALAAEHERDRAVDSRRRPSARCPRRRSRPPRARAPSAPRGPGPRCRCAPPARARGRPRRRGSPSPRGPRCGARAAARRRRPPPPPCAGWRPGCAGPRRRRAPRRSAGVARLARAASRASITGLAETTAMRPWCGTPPAMRSRVSRASKRSGMPSWLARAIASETRWLRRPLTTSRRSKWRVPAASASSTGLIPQMRFMALLSDASRARERCSSTTAWAAMPSPRPEGAQAVGALGLDRHARRAATPSACAIAARMASRCGASAGAWAITVTSRFSSAKPRSPQQPRDLLQEDAAGRALPARVAAREVARPCRPAPARPAARRRPRAARSRRRSGPRARGRAATRTPPSISGRPATSRWASKPVPTRMARHAVAAALASEHASAQAQVVGRRDLAVARRARRPRPRGSPRRSTAMASSVSGDAVADAALVGLARAARSGSPAASGPPPSSRAVERLRDRAVAHALDGVDERQHGRRRPSRAAAARHGVDERRLHQRPRRVVDEHDAVEPSGSARQAGAHRVLPRARRPPPPPAACAARRSSVARRRDARPRARPPRSPPPTGAASKAARRAQRAAARPASEQEGLGPARAHALAAPGGDQDGEGVHEDTAARLSRPREPRQSSSPTETRRSSGRSAERPPPTAGRRRLGLRGRAASAVARRASRQRGRAGRRARSRPGRARATGGPRPPRPSCRSALVEAAQARPRAGRCPPRSRSARSGGRGRARRAGPASTGTTSTPSR